MRRYAGAGQMISMALRIPTMAAITTASASAMRVLVLPCCHQYATVRPLQAAQRRAAESDARSQRRQRGGGGGPAGISWPLKAGGYSVPAMVRLSVQRKA